MAMHTELWFPSVIWSSVVNEIDNQELRKYAYDRRKVDKGRVISNFGGWQSSDILNGECPQIDKLVKLLNTEMNSCANQVGLHNLQIQNLWININSTGTYNHLHHHVGSVFSGVYYVQAQEGNGNIQFERTDNAEYHIPLRVAKDTYFTSTRATYASKTNALYIFPSWLKHSVQGNAIKEDRISISFNYGEVF